MRPLRSDSSTSVMLAASILVVAGALHAQEQDNRIVPTGPRLTLDQLQTKPEQAKDSPSLKPPKAKAPPSSPSAQKDSTDAKSPDDAVDPSEFQPGKYYPPTDESIRKAISRFVEESPLNRKRELMDRARRKSQRTVAELINSLQKPAENQTGHAFRKEFETKEGIESIWFEAMGYNPGTKKLIGKVANTPSWKKDLKKGDVVTLDPKEVEDWMFIEGIRLVGGNTIRVELWDGPREERYAFEDRMGFIVSQFFDDEDPGMWEPIPIAGRTLWAEVPKDFFRSIEPNGMRLIQPSNGLGILVHFLVIDRGGKGIAAPLGEQKVKDEAKRRGVALQEAAGKPFFIFDSRKRHDNKDYIIRFWQVGYGARQVQISATIEPEKKDSRAVRRVLSIMPRIIGSIQKRDPVASSRDLQSPAVPASSPQPTTSPEHNDGSSPLDTFKSTAVPMAPPLPR